jgi:hypothetical protein
MALQTSGQISLNDLHIEAGGTTGTQVSLNDTDIRGLISKSSGVQMSVSEWYGASNSVVINLVIASNTNNYNLFSSKGGTYSAGNTTVNVTINSGVTVGSTTSGTYAFTTGLGWVTGDVINIINNGTIKGRGGNGGAGGSAVYNSSVTNAGNGGTGGPAFRGQFACTVTNNGSVYGGGGGGGGGGSFYGSLTINKVTTTISSGAGGGGGGAGVNGGTGGSGGSASGGSTSTIQGTPGSAGTATAGGAGGTNAGSGGAGGGLGADGAAGVVVAEENYTAPEDFGNVGTGGTRGYYQVGSIFINGGSGLSGTVGGRSA